MKNLFLAFLFLPAVSFADEAKKTNQMNFEEEHVAGETKNPAVEAMITQKSRNFGKLIKMRDNFNSEISKDGDSVRSKK